MACIKAATGVLFTLLVALLLSGCVTRRLNESIKKQEAENKLYSSDNIDAAAYVSLGGEKNVWVLKGTHFDYVLDAGGDEFLRAIAEGKLTASHLISGKGEFILSTGKKHFEGSLALRYRYTSENDMNALLPFVKDSGWSCSEHYDGTMGCTVILASLKGTLHQKSPDLASTVRLNQAVGVKFYTKSSPSMKRLLYPAAVVADVVMSPVYLVGYVVFINTVRQPR